MTQSSSTSARKSFLREPERSPVCGEDQHGAENAHVVSDQLELIPELHLTRVVPVAQVPVDEQDDRREDGGQDLSRQTDVAAGEKSQSQNPEQNLQQHQSDLSSNYVVQISLLVLFAVLQGVHLVAESGTTSFNMNLNALVRVYTSVMKVFMKSCFIS